MFKLGWSEPGGGIGEFQAQGAACPSLEVTASVFLK